MNEKHFISFLNSNIGNCKNFLWREALWLPRWKIFVLPDEEVAKNIIEIATKLQIIRDIFSRPIQVTSWFRPPEYNVLIGGASRSAHMAGKAVDFVVRGIPSEDVRNQILALGLLEKHDLRMEDLPNASWVHIDNNPVINNRFFKP